MADPSKTPEGPSARTAAEAAERIETDRKAKQSDPHGTGHAEAAGEDEPMGQPNSDRHLTETAGSKIASETPDGD